MRTLAIGDIHGYADVLETLLQSFDLEGTRLVFLGDYVDRGPQTREVLERLIELADDPAHIFLRGNHDEWMLRSREEKHVFKSWVGEGFGGKETLRSYGAAKFNEAALELVPIRHWQFLEATRLFYEDDFHIYVHASLSWPAAPETTKQVLLWGNLYQIPPQQNGKRVICGHTSLSSGVPLDLEHAVGIDTFCSGTRWLSAFDVEADEVFQANSAGETRRFRLREAPL